MVNLSNLSLRPPALPGGGKRTFELNSPAETLGETSEAQCPEGLPTRLQNSQDHLRGCFSPSLCLFGSSDLDPPEALAGGAARLTGRSFCVFARNNLCSGHVAVTLALSAAAEKAGCRPKKANGRNTLSCQGPSSPSSEARDPPRPGCSLPRNSVHILFWSVGDLFTRRSSFLLPTNFLLQK